MSHVVHDVFCVGRYSNPTPAAQTAAAAGGGGVGKYLPVPAKKTKAED
jgi:hypothetical protein